jgi:hypothetical protein
MCAVVLQVDCSTKQVEEAQQKELEGSRQYEFDKKLSGLRLRLCHIVARMCKGNETEWHSATGELATGHYAIVTHNCIYIYGWRNSLGWRIAVETSETTIAGTLPSMLKRVGPWTLHHRSQTWKDDLQVQLVIKIQHVDQQSLSGRLWKLTHKQTTNPSHWTNKLSCMLDNLSWIATEKHGDTKGVPINQTTCSMGGTRKTNRRTNPQNFYGGSDQY